MGIVIKTLVGASIALWTVDQFVLASSLERNARTIGTAAVIALDYKLNFNRRNSLDIEQLHSRVAKRILDVCKHNGGLYIKFGQQIASVPVLPKEYSQVFKELYDNAPVIDFKVVEQILKEEFGKSPDELFRAFGKEPVASASIAQVHKAELLDGTEVAVKVQKPEIATQLWLDMMTYRLVISAFDYLFELPLYWTADYIEGHLRQETDFMNEARNSERANGFLKQCKTLDKRVYVPRVMWGVTSKRVMTAEWIDGIRFSDETQLLNKGFSATKIMETIVEVFADQIFRTGFVHCDPHPVNILLRIHPDSKQQQVVLLDHGLYVQCDQQVTHDYALLWKALFIHDAPTINRICNGWGVRDVQLFASATLQKPWRQDAPVHLNTKPTLSDLYDAQIEAKSKMKRFLSETEFLPKELIFISRNLNCVRANNRMLGSPVNRINLMANWAVKSLGTNWCFKKISFLGLAQAYIDYWTFHTTLFAVSVTFWITQTVRRIKKAIGLPAGNGFESVMDSAIRNALQEHLPGFVLDDSIFDG